MGLISVFLLLLFTICAAAASCLSLRNSHWTFFPCFIVVCGRHTMWHEFPLNDWKQKLTFLFLKKKKKFFMLVFLSRLISKVISWRNELSQCFYRTVFTIKSACCSSAVLIRQWFRMFSCFNTWEFFKLTMKIILSINKSQGKLTFYELYRLIWIKIWKLRSFILSNCYDRNMPIISLEILSSVYL